MAKFIKSLLQKPKGNGIARKVRQAEHKVAVEKTKKAGEYISNTATVFGATAAFHGLADTGVPLATSFASASGVCSYVLWKKGAMNGIKEAVKQCKALKASEEYQAVLERAARIKKAAN